MKTLIQAALILVSNTAFAANGIYADISFGGEVGTVQANGNSELLISQKDGTQNGIWKIDGKIYVGFKQPNNAWSVFDPSGMGQGFTPSPQPETKITLKKTNQEVVVAKRKGLRYDITSEEEGKVEKGYMIASKDKDVKLFNSKLFDLISAMQNSARGGQATPGAGMESIFKELKKRDIGVLEFGDEAGNSSFKLTRLDRRDVVIKLPTEPGSPFANIGGPGVGDLGMGGSGQNGAPTEADIQRQIEELKQQFQQSQIDQAKAQQQVEAEWHEKERLKQQQAIESSSESASDAAVANENAASPMGSDIGKKVGDLLKGWGR